MVTSESPSILDLTVEDLLGWPLNDVEQKFAPGTLYVKGSLKIPLPKPRVSIVGSRKASQNGLLDAKLIAGILASKEVVIVSGLAEGIDTSAHLAAIGAASKLLQFWEPL
jgi:DNA processing protein